MKDWKVVVHALLILKSISHRSKIRVEPMAKYYFSNKAVEDLAEIWSYTLENWSENQADKYYKALLVSCNDLAKNPKLGKQYDILTKGILGYKSGEHIIFYGICSTTEIEIVRILHGMMDLRIKL